MDSAPARTRYQGLMVPFCLPSRRLWPSADPFVTYFDARKVGGFQDLMNPVAAFDTKTEKKPIASQIIVSKMYSAKKKKTAL